MRPSRLVTLLAALATVLALVSPVAAEDVSFDELAAQPSLTINHSNVFRLYWAYFDRIPDTAGALYWASQVDGCLSLIEVSNYFEMSDEFNLTYGDLTDDAFVDLVYENVLDRPAEPGGRTYWLGMLTTAGLSRGRLMAEFSLSREFTMKHRLPSDSRPAAPCSPNTAHDFYLNGYEHFATASNVDLYLPAQAIELVGFHESNQDGARPLVPTDLGYPQTVMESRNRDNPARGAADIAINPLLEIRSPVTGVVKRSGRYTLYCSIRDDFVVISPDAHPDWEVKVLHIKPVMVNPGDRVTAGETVISAGAHKLPLNSQLDKLTPNPSWPHVHLEVIDPSVPDRPGSGC